MLSWKKSRKDSLLSAVEKIERIFDYFENKVNEDIFSQIFRFVSPKHETVDQLENVVVFVLETYNDQKFSEAYAIPLYDVNR